MGNFERFLEALGRRESNGQYDCVNTLGFTGKYQFGEAILIDLGYYEADRFYNGGANGITRCLWEGRWKEKAKQKGVHSYDDFKNNKGNIQEAVIRDELKYNTRIILREVGGRDNLHELLKERGYTYSGILAAAHLQGPWGAANLLKSGGRRCDEYGTCITDYAQTFSKPEYDFGLLE